MSRAGASRPLGGTLLGAVVLAGGQARRMGGVDKLALVVDGKTVLDRVLDATAAVAHPVVAVGPRRPTSVPGVLWTVEDKRGGGPVPAVASGLAVIGPSPGWVLVVAGDLARLSAGDLRALVAAASRSPTGAAAETDRGLEPLLAVYPVAGLARRLATLGPGAAAREMLRPGVKPVRLSAGAGFNLNSPADFATLAGRG